MSAPPYAGGREESGQPYHAAKTERHGKRAAARLEKRLASYANGSLTELVHREQSVVTKLSREIHNTDSQLAKRQAQLASLQRESDRLVTDALDCDFALDSQAKAELPPPYVAPGQ